MKSRPTVKLGSTRWSGRRSSSPPEWCRRVANSDSHIIPAIRESTAIRDDILDSVIGMAKNLVVGLYVVVLIVVVVSVDLLFFRHHVWDRLIVNIGIVLVFAAVYLRFVKKHEL